MIVTKVEVSNEWYPKCDEFREVIRLEGITTCENEKYDAHELIGEDIPVCLCEENWCEEPLKEPKYGGSFIVDGEEVYIKEVIYNDPNTIVLWSDGTKTRCTKHEEDKWNPEMSLLMCVMKKVTCSTKHLSMLLEDWAITSKTKKKNITLKDIRKTHKEI